MSQGVQNVISRTIRLAVENVTNEAAIPYYHSLDTYRETSTHNDSSVRTSLDLVTRNTTEDIRFELLSMLGPCFGQAYATTIWLS